MALEKRFLYSTGLLRRHVHQISGGKTGPGARGLLH